LCINNGLIPALKICAKHYFLVYIPTLVNEQPEHDKIDFALVGQQEISHKEEWQFYKLFFIPSKINLGLKTSEQ
jgi:hypothetical protein